jgi:hypothetical protein
MTGAAVLLGAWLAPRIGFHSRLLDRDWPRLTLDVRVALIPGVLAGTLIISGDLILSPFLGEQWAQAQAQESRTLAVTAAGMLYGGINEELQMRWGLVSLCTYAGWKAFSRRTRPPTPIVLGSIALAALIFGVLHLGAVAAVVELTAPIVARTIALNAVAGIIFGLLFARRSIEAAMISHAVAHLTMTALAALL